MASLFSISSAPVATLPCVLRMRGIVCQNQLSTRRLPMAAGLRMVPRIRFTKPARRTTITCSIAQPETLSTVQSTIAKQLSVDESTVTPETKFADLGADSLDTVEIMMALEEKFEVSIGEGGAENIATVQDAADLIEKVKAASA